MESETRCLLGASISLLSGLVLGLSAGLLYAPQRGSRTRRQLKNMVEDAGERVEEWADGTTEAVSAVVKRGQRLAERGQSCLKL